MAGSRRAQVVLPTEEYSLVEDYARERGLSMSALLRDVVGRTLVARLRQRRREAALRRLTQQGLPTADWETIERDLETMWNDHDPA